MRKKNLLIIHVKTKPIEHHNSAHFTVFTTVSLTFVTIQTKPYCKVIVTDFRPCWHDAYGLLTGSSYVMNDIFRTCAVRLLHMWLNLHSLSHYNLTATMNSLSVRWNVKNVKRCLQSLPDNYTIMVSDECPYQDVFQDDPKMIGFSLICHCLCKLGHHEKCIVCKMFRLGPPTTFIFKKTQIYIKSVSCGLLKHPAINE